MNNSSTAQPVASFGWSGFHHVALVTADLDQTIRFYREVLGMEVSPVYPATPPRGRHCFIKPGTTDAWGIHFFESADALIHQSDDALRRLAANPQGPDLYRFIPGALQHVAFALPSETAGLALRSQLQRHDVLMTGIYDQGSLRNFIFLDPNGIQLEAAWASQTVIG
ncbi:VOC family protein [Paenibacillus sp. 1P07SE]|uniref:VOC family protein n=1 Tax=Paenibacillus sp. 1P07SE TaxID=3132209 RepID=UPI0039A6D8E2